MLIKKISINIVLFKYARKTQNFSILLSKLKENVIFCMQNFFQDQLFKVNFFIKIVLFKDIFFFKIMLFKNMFLFKIRRAVKYLIQNLFFFQTHSLDFR